MIGLFDSGVGGMSVFREVARLLPQHGYVYYSDNANCPYGDKSPDFIAGRAREITSLLLSKGCKAIVVACNTATAAAIKQLRQEFHGVPFVGMEPALKPAAASTRSGVVGGLATAATLRSEKYLDGKRKYGTGVRILERVGRGFVELVESGELTGQDAESVVRASVAPLVEGGADTIVLGCTHYPFLMDLIRKVAGPGVEVLDPAPSAARHLIYLMVQHGLLDERSATQALSRIGTGAQVPRNPKVELLSSGDPAALMRVFSLVTEHA